MYPFLLCITYLHISTYRGTTIVGTDLTDYYVRSWASKFSINMWVYK